jgi:hypothetical protein
MTDKAALLNQVRYAERLSERTARLYRNLQVAGTIATVLSGSAILSVLASSMPSWLYVVGSALFVIFGACMLAIGPANKAAANEADRKRYARLRVEGLAMSAEELEVAFAKAMESNTQEVEALRDVAQNDVLIEAGWPESVVPLSKGQRLLAMLA